MKMQKQSLLRGLGLAAALGLAFCSNQAETPTPTDPQQGTQQEQGPDYGINHDDILNNIGNIFTDGRQVSPAVGEKLHSCGKVRYGTLMTILSTRGVNVTNTAANSAGALLPRAQGVWGVANFPGRAPETIRDTTSSLVSLHDILIAAAEELVTATNTDGAYPAAVTACTGAKLFNNNTCDKDGFACLMGATPSQNQLAACTSMINDATAGVTVSLDRRRLAVAAMAGTVAMCD
jgi:hypothetical protein